MLLSQSLRAELWPSINWVEQFEISAAAVAHEVDASRRSERYFELASLAENLLPNRERAVELYNAAWQAGMNNHRALIRARYLCRELGRLDLVAKIAELEHGHTGNPECQLIAGLAWLDAGKPDRAVLPLLAARAADPDNAVIADSLAVAQKEWPDVRAEIERLEQLAAAAGPEEASLHYLQAARILNMLGTDAEESQAVLRLAIAAQPRNDSAHALLEGKLVAAQNWSELLRLAERRAEASLTAYEGCEIYRRWGTAFSLHHKQPELGVPLLMRSLVIAYDHQLEDVPGQLATHALLREHARHAGGLEVVVGLAERAFDTPLTADEQLGLAIHTAPAARQLGNRAAALGFIGTVCRLVPTHPLAVSFSP